MTASGELGPLLRKAKAEGWGDRIRGTNDERAVLAGCRFDAGLAERAVQFFARLLRHSKGKWAGEPFILADWQRVNIIEPLFGWLTPEGVRRFRTAYIEVPKKNGKSTLAAGVGMYLLVGDGEPGAEIYTAATKIKQAAIVHDEAVRMVQASPALSKRLRINFTTKVISFDAMNSKYEALAADAQGSEGLNIHGLICDELHVWQGREYWDALRFGGIARRQPLRFTITTAGVYNKASLGWEQHQYALDVQGGQAENTAHLVFIACADPKDDWQLPETHRKANPAYGTVIDPVEIAEAAAEVRNKPAELNSFLRYRLNIWTEQLDRVVDMHAWDECGAEFNEDDLVGRRCHGGLDLSSKKDLTAFVLIFPPDEPDGLWLVLPRFWVPQEAASERERADQVPYMTWARQGFLNLTPGVRTDYECIREQIESDRKRFDVVDIGADPWNLEYLRQRLDPSGELIREYSQQLKDMSPPMKELIHGLVPERRLAHRGHPVLRWNAANLAAYQDANENIRPDKKRSKDRIDGVVALIMALGRAMISETKQDSVYETRGMLRF